MHLSHIRPRIRTTVRMHLARALLHPSPGAKAEASVGRVLACSGKACLYDMEQACCTQRARHVVICTQERDRHVPSAGTTLCDHMTARAVPCLRFPNTPVGCAAPLARVCSAAGWASFPHDAVPKLA